MSKFNDHAEVSIAAGPAAGLRGRVLGGPLPNGRAKVVPSRKEATEQGRDWPGPVELEPADLVLLKASPLDMSDEDLLAEYKAACADEDSVVVVDFFLSQEVERRSLIGIRARDLPEAEGIASLSFKYETGSTGPVWAILEDGSMEPILDNDRATAWWRLSEARAMGKALGVEVRTN